MSLLSFTGLSKAFGLQVCFDAIDGDVQDGDRIGLIGANGTGKSTLAKVLAGLEPPDDGTVNRKKELAVEYLSQETEVQAGQTLREAAMEAFADVRDIEHRIHELSEKMADPDCTPDEMEAALEETGQLQHELEARGGYVIDSRTNAVLMGLGFGKDDFDKPAEGLSGGERSRVGLARVLLREPQLMILDEPTNHLDITGVQWLEGYLRDTFNGAFIVISHDRYFLDQVCSRIFELERGDLHAWRGNYSRSRELKAEEMERQQRQFEQQQAEIEKQKDFIRRFGANQRARQAKGRKRRLERFLRDEAIDRPDDRQAKAKLEFSTDLRVGADVIELRDITFGFTETPLFENVNLQVHTNEVLGIVGPNGAGKSTLLAIMTGEREPQGGSLKVGSTIQMQTLHQRETFPDSDTTILDHAHEKLPKMTNKQIRDLMAALLFSGDELQKPLKVLSGGEKKRVALAELLMSDANLLVLDEPTNHLDLPTREALEDALAGFPGTIVMVSHDRYLLDRLCDRVLWLAPTTGWALAPPDDPAAAARPEHRAFRGGYSEMLEQVRKEQRERAEKRAKAEADARAAAAAKKSGGGSSGGKSSSKPAKRKRKFKGTIGELEEAIEELQAKLLEVETELGAPDTYEDADKVKELTELYDQLKSDVDDLETEWLERSAD